MKVKVWVPNPSNVDKNGHLVDMLVHGLHFILNLKAIVFYKINYWNYNVIREILKAKLEHLVLPSSNKVVVGKELEFGL
jgi:hypothetical protein